MAAQVRSNHTIARYKAMLRAALDKLHEEYLSVREELLELDPHSGDTPHGGTLSVDIPLPPLDTASSRPRSITPTHADAEELTRQLEILRAGH